MNTIIKTTNLTKVYGNQKSVDNLNINVQQGEIYGFIGRNGAGKTTTIRMLLSLIKPTSGTIEIFGEN
ncbi:ATP-binding cassette domain-containing protein, partial [Acinetobacter baumannii]|nr:ATP-binding cassette domain-containing protein [Acinetobacter baumannii]